MARRRYRPRGASSPLAAGIAVLTLLATIPTGLGSLTFGLAFVLLILLGFGLVIFLGIRLVSKRLSFPSAATPTPPFRCIDLDRPDFDTADQSTTPPQLTQRAGTARQPSVETSPPRPTGTSSRASRFALREQLQHIDWYQFEKLMALAYQKQGFDVERRGGAHADGGIDLLLSKNGERVAVQCKHWKAWKANPKTVRELRGAMAIENIAKAVLISLKGFTEAARKTAADCRIDLVEEHQIVQMLEQTDAAFDPAMTELSNDERKFCPRCESPMVLKTARKGIHVGENFWSCSRYPACDGKFST
ncbi:MAG: DUF2034 domain-containing protein [Verrucomicrobiales bacterium]|nr:DUF2034 domain-containing protein [Verrucomicrobiales bacterium]